MAWWDGGDFAKGNTQPLTKRLLRAQVTSHSILQEDHPKPGRWSERTSKDDLVEKPGALWAGRRASHYLAILALRSGFLRRAHPEPLSQYLSPCACLLSWLRPPHPPTLVPFDPRWRPPGWCDRPEDCPLGLGGTPPNLACWVEKPWGTFDSKLDQNSWLRSGVESKGSQ